MKVKHLPLILLTFFLSIPNSYALICKRVDGIIRDSIEIDTNTAIPSTLPEGTILWRQPTRTLTVECWVDIPGHPSEKVYFYPNPDKRDLGDDIEVGVTFQGKDYLYSSLPGGKLDIGWYVRGCAAEPCGIQKERKRLTYSIFFSKKSPASANKEGPLAPFPWYRAFQLDGVGGVRPGQSYNLTVRGLGDFRYVPCASTVSISPSTINFGPISTSGAAFGATIKETPFTITEMRSCNAVYGVSGYLEPLNATLSSDERTLIPTNNDSVGIAILDPRDQTVIPFKQEFVLTPEGTGSQYNSREFLARLTWMSATPQLGEFNAGATLNIFYK
ncbi:fimbrial protein [Pseudomonas resinovorans]|uniref:Fimbrial protein n=1 Tax=Metapseudomonas resinovorans TaxID=53412 RepID=A0ABT4XZ33_METRE|nr:fimbrial protein [Pseudomonas resinovorans]MDA8481690.1 fimbrial protein [Pseudomonas resinovorans]